MRYPKVMDDDISVIFSRGGRPEGMEIYCLDGTFIISWGRGERAKFGRSVYNVVGEEME